MAITNKKKLSKIPERLVFITSPIIFLWLFSMSFSPDSNVILQCNLGLSQCHETQAYYNGYLIGSILGPILFGISYLATGLYLRRNRLKKEMKQWQ